MTMLCITNDIPGRSCTIRGYHLTDVDGTVHYSRPGVECTGCLPRPAETGMLCGFCWTRLQAALTLTPDLIPHLRSIEKGPADVAGVRTAPGSRVILPASWMEADKLWVSLAQVAIVHAKFTRTEEPDWRPDTSIWSGFAASASIRAVTAATWALRNWIDSSAEQVVAHVDGATAAIEYFRAVQRALAMFPMSEQTRQMRFIRCRTCQQETLRLVPPLEQPDDPTLTCSNRECGAEWDPTLAGFDMLALARTIAAERDIAMSDLQKDIAELLRAPSADEADPLCWTHARGLAATTPALLVRKVKPVEEECVRCGIKTESGLYRRVIQEVAA